MNRSPAWCHRVVCRACSVRASVLFAGVAPELLAPIEAQIDEARLPARARLYPLGGRADAVFTVQSGLIKLVQSLPDGTERIVRLLSGGDVAGLEALVEQPYQQEAVVLQTARICRIPVAVLRQLAEESPPLYGELMRRWQRALAEADAWLTELSTGSARQRVARLLLRLADSQGEGRCALFNRRDLGASLGVTTESASRAVANLKREGLLLERPGGFHIDPAGMARAALNPAGG